MGGDAPVSEITTVPQVKQTLMELPLQNTGKFDLVQAEREVMPQSVREL